MKKKTAPPMMAAQRESERTEHFFERADRGCDISTAPFRREERAEVVASLRESGLSESRMVQAFRVVAALAF